MAAGWSTVVVVAGAFFAGCVTTGAYYERAARKAAELQLATAKEQPAVQVAAERRMAAAEHAQQQSRTQTRAAVTAAPDLAGCPVPADLAGMLDAQVAATRAPGAPVPGGAVHRPSPAVLPRAGGDARADLR